MGLRISDTYAKIWNIDRKEKYSVVELSVRKKNRTTDQYETDFSSKFVRFVGNAHQQLINMQGNERAKGKTANLWRYRALAGGFYIFMAVLLDIGY